MVPEVELYAKYQGASGAEYTQYRRLDLISSEPIKWTKRVQDLEDPTAVGSSYSQIFRLPNTQANNQFFKAVFNVNSFDFDVTVKVDSYINVSGAYFTSGYIRLDNIIGNFRDGSIEYEVSFVGQVGSFASVVGAKTLPELDMTGINHARTYANVVGSWTGGLLSGNVIYPLVEYGYTYNQTTKQPNITTLSLYNATTAVRGFTNSSYPLALNQLRPWIRAKYIWDQIFEESGFTYTSTFLNSARFTDLYAYTLPGAEVTQPNADFRSAFEVDQAIPNNVATQLRTVGEVYDYSDSYNTATYSYVSKFTGTFTFVAAAIYAFFNTTPGPIWQDLEVRLYKNGTQIASQAGYVNTAFNFGYVFSNTGAGDTNFGFTGVSLVEGDVINIRLFISSAKITNFVMKEGFWYSQAPSYFLGSMSMNPEYKQLDFIKGINDRFKLMWEPDPDQPGNFLIEPFNDWMEAGTERDWTAKIDGNLDTQLKPLFYTQVSKLTFADAEDADVLNESYQKAYKETFGELLIQSPIELLTGERTISSMFAPLPVGPIGNATKFLIPHLAKDTETERQPMQPRPRLGYYDGVVPSPFTWYFVSATGAQTSYPLVSNFESYPFLEGVYDLSWTNSPQFWDVNEVGATAAGAGATNVTTYTEYWENWYNLSYSKWSRTLELTLVLDYKDILDVQMNDRIWLIDSWWMPVEISDYVLGGGKQKIRCKFVKYTQE